MMALFWLRLAWRFIHRGWRATLTLGSMVLTAVAALIVLASVAVGTNDAMIRNSVGLFSGHIACSGLPPEMDVGALLLPGVRAALLRDELPVRLRQGAHAEELLLLGVDASAETRNTALPRKLLAGVFLSGDNSGIVLGAESARVLQAALGQSLIVEDGQGRTLGAMTVDGIYQTGLTALDRGMALCRRQALPAVAATRSAALFLADGASSQRVLDALAGLPAKVRGLAWTQFMPDLEQLVQLNYLSMSIVMVLVFGVVALGIACAFVIFLLKGLREYGILKAMGLRPAECAGLILTQVGLLALTAAAMGTLLGTLAVAALAHTGIDLSAMTSHNRYFVVSGVIYPRLTPFSMGLPPLLALIFSALAALWPIGIIGRARAVAILRAL